MFPKSPEIIFNVFAVLQEKTKGFNRQFTIVNFEDMEAFKAAREKLQKAWDAHPNDYVNGRNKLVSTKVRVRVKGIYNQVSVNQANPQVLIKSADDITIIDK
jgi:superoxide dismutase